MFQAADVPLDPGTKRLRPLGAIHMDIVGQRLKMNVILSAPLVETEKQNDRNVQESSQQKRSLRKHSRLAEEVACHSLFITEDAIS